MNEKSGYKFGIRPSRQIEGAWSFGCCFTHAFGETYLFINFAVWTIGIGWYMEDREEIKWLS